MTGKLKPIKAERGQALIIVLVLLVVGMLVITPFLYMTSVLNKRVQAGEKVIYAFYSSDAGVEYALYKLRNGLPYTGAAPENVNPDMSTVITTVYNPPHTGTEYHYTVTVITTKSGAQVSRVDASVTCIQSSPPYALAVTNWTVQ